VNFDAAFHRSTEAGAWGFVARTDEGEFIAAAAGKLRHLHDALQAETEACVAATEGAAALGLHRVIFESDSQILVNALNSSSHDLATIGVLLRETLMLLNFRSLSVIVIRWPIVWQNMAPI
jgi:ribonuclease HI